MAVRPSSSSGAISLRAWTGPTYALARVVFGGVSRRFAWTVGSGGSRRVSASACMAAARPSSKEDGQTALEAKRLSKEAGGSPKAAKRPSNGGMRHGEAAVSVSMSNVLVGASNNPTCGSKLANRTRPPAELDPSGAPSRKISEWIVPKTETRGAGNAVSVGPACVPADFRMNPRSIAAIPTGIARTPRLANTSPTPTHVATAWQRTSPDAGGIKHADCGKNRSDRALWTAIAQRHGGLPAVMPHLRPKTLLPLALAVRPVQPANGQLTACLDGGAVGASPTARPPRRWQLGSPRANKRAWEAAAA